MDDDLDSKYEPIVPQEVQQTPKRRKHKRINSDDTERPASAQRDSDDSEQHSDIEVEQKLPDDDEADPAAQIADFDWEHLHQRYHDAIKTCSDEEAELMQEWSNLMEVLMSPFWTTQHTTDYATVLPHLGKFRTQSRDRSNIPEVRCSKRVLLYIC